MARVQVPVNIDGWTSFFADFELVGPLEGQPTTRPGVCEFCHCTDERACEGGCAWVNDEHTICSVCVDDLGELVGGFVERLVARRRVARAAARRGRK